MLDENQKFKILIDIGFEIGKAKDLDLLLERILSVARKFSNADAGSIYLTEGKDLKFSKTQNDTIQKSLPSGQKLPFSYFKVPIDYNSIAGYVASTGEIVNIEDVRTISEDSPYSFNSQYDELSGYRTKSVLTIPMKKSGGEVIGVLQLINAKSDDGKIISFSRDDEPYIQYLAQNAALAVERAQITRGIIMRMIQMAELRDPRETGPHANRVAEYAVEIYEHWATSYAKIPREDIAENIDVLRMAAMLHDIGKVAIPDAILKKPARLDDREFEIIKQHTILGARLFSNSFSTFDRAALAVALEHHERWDGTGYPGHVDIETGKPIAGYEIASGCAAGKKGNEIHPFGRVVSIADVFDALSMRRSYKEAWDEKRVLDTIEKSAGKQFDPDMVNSFFFVLDSIKAITSRFQDEPSIK